MNAKKQLHAKGHTLVAEGKPFDRWGVRLYPEVGPDGHRLSGRALCSCGKMSPILESDRARIRWHADHKKEVLASHGSP